MSGKKGRRKGLKKAGNATERRGINPKILHKYQKIMPINRLNFTE